MGLTLRPPLPRFVYFLLLGDMLSMGLLFPVLPNLVMRLVGLGQSWVFWYGATTLATALAFFFAASVTGTFSDRLGRRPFMLLNCVGLAVGNLTAGLASDLWILMAARAWCGFCNTNISLAHAYVADLSSPEERGRRFGLLGATQGLGFILGPLLGGYLGHGDDRIPFFLAAGITLICGIAGCFFLPESLSQKNRASGNATGFQLLDSLRGLWDLPGFRGLAPAIGLVMLTRNTMFVVWVPYATIKFGWDATENGWALFVVGLGSCLAQAVIFPGLLKKISLRQICLMGLVSSVLAYACFGWARDGWVVYTVMILNVLGFCMFPGFQTLVSRLSDPRSQGRTLGGLQALNNLALVFAPLITSGLLFWMGRYAASDWGAGIPMFFCAGLNLLVFVLAFRNFPHGEIKTGDSLLRHET